MPIRIGYPCQNLTLDATTNHTTRLAFVRDEEKLRSLVEQNIEDAARCLRWNAENGYGLFRLGSSFVPFASHPWFTYDWREAHQEQLAELGRLADALDQRLSMHPGQFVNPGSPDRDVVERSLAELRYAAELFDAIGSRDPVTVIHLGGAYEDRGASMDRFVSVLCGEPGVLRTLALENDERVWNVAEAVEAAERLGDFESMGAMGRVGVIVDNLHHTINPGELSLEEAVAAAAATWGERRQKLHLSSQDPDKRPGAHAYAIDPADWNAMLDAVAGRMADIMVEAKGKEHAIPPGPLRRLVVRQAAAERTS